MTLKLDICILAAGIGSRMKSDKPKVMQTLGGQPLLAHLLKTVQSLGDCHVHVVIGPEGKSYADQFERFPNIDFVEQRDRLGTGHALMQAMPLVRDEAVVMVLLGDGPLVSQSTLDSFRQLDCDLGILSVDMEDPFNYGRIIRDESGGVVAIVEERDASAEQKRLREINTGGMLMSAESLHRWLPQLTTENEQQEYLLTDIVSIAVAEGAKVDACKANDPMEVTGINTFSQLAALERQFQLKQAEQLMAAGVQIMDPARLDIRGEVVTGRNVKIDVNVIFEGNVELGDDVVIGPNCVITDCRIGQGSEIKANSVLEGALLESGCAVGPFARLRPGTVLSEDVAIGNFVEVKKSKLGKGSKASHLAYLGDSTIGHTVNIGAGTITCNYDGVNKWETHVGNDVFIGSNTSLVAPVSIGNGSTTGAGSTITKDVQDGVLALGRGRQAIIDKWKRPVKADKKISGDN